MASQARLTTFLRRPYTRPPTWLPTSDYPLPGGASTNTAAARTSAINRETLTIRASPFAGQHVVTTTPAPVSNKLIDMKTQSELPKSKDQASKFQISLKNAEVSSHECSPALKADLSDLFPDRDLSQTPLCALVIVRRTQHDMSGWSEAMEVEREELTREFIENASAICARLRSSGYWADLIDPSCARPYLGGYTNATLAETDERNRAFGLQIEDMGCCRVLMHPVFGYNVFAGLIFTDAPRSKIDALF